MSVSSIDIAWLAGLVEGEGCFKNNGSTPSIVVQMTDQDVIQKIANLFNTKIMGPYGPYAAQKQPTYIAQYSGKAAVGWMMTLYNLLGERRKAKIEELLNQWKKRQTVNPNRKSACHSDEPYFAKNLCRKCYMKKYHEDKKNAHSPS